MVTHACNLRCTYCYAGAKSARAMPDDVATKAIDRALASVEQGGVLELGFFGGEPLLEAALISRLLGYARERARARRVKLSAGLTTNGTVWTADAWSVMSRPDVDLAVSHDGLPEVHNRHRRHADGAGSSARVIATMRRLCAIGKEFRVVMVVRPDNVPLLSAGVLFLRALGVRCIEPSLDLWARWTPDDVRQLEGAVGRCARIWRDGLPEFSVSWFDQKAAHLARVPMADTARCGFGEGEVAVAPSGRLYPCERLIGADEDGNLMRLPGHVFDSDDFLQLDAPPPCRSVECAGCAVRAMCNTDCRCSNYVRTGDATRPDGLLCALNRACLREAAKVLADAPPAAVA
jgi:uncharacterized protein